MSSIHHPGFSGPVNYSLQEVSDDPDTQVAQTIGLMADYCRQDAPQAMVLQDAASAAASGGGDLVGGVFDTVRSELAYTPDDNTAAPFTSWAGPAGDIVETLVRPVDVSIERRQGNRVPGDCDDFSMRTACLLMALGVPCAFVTVAADDQDPSRYSHVYVAAYPTSGPYAGQRVALDTSHGPYPGWECPDKFGKRQEWQLESNSVAGLLLVLGIAVAVYFGGGSSRGSDYE